MTALSTARFWPNSARLRELTKRLFADAVLLRRLRDRRLIGFAENLDHLFFGESKPCA